MTTDRLRLSRPSAGRLRLVACSLALVALAFRQSPGLTVPDTKLDLTADPGGFLARAMHLWDSAAAFGQLQNQAYGYLFPMGPFHLLGELAGLPAWITQRAWWSLILVTAFLGTVRLAREAGIGRAWTRLLAGLVYALSPRILVSLGAVSIEAWPTALAPWVLIPLVRAWRGGPVIRNAALSALAVLCLGGVNAAATAAAVVPALSWLVLAPGWPGRARFATWWFACMAAVTLWWWGPLLLLGRYSPPFLDWIETASNTTQHASLIEVFRGSDHWLSYLSGPAGPQWPAGWLLAAEPVLILDTVLVAAVGLAGLARRDLPGRRVLLTTAVTGLAIVSAGYVGSAGSPLAEHVRGLLDGPLAPLRNVHKFDLVIRLPLALGLAHAAASVRFPALSARRFRALAAGFAVVVLAGVATPALAGRLPQAGSYEAIPTHWYEAAAWLDEHVGSGRALLVPASSFAEYGWGSPRDEPLQALGDVRWAVRDSVPLSSAGNIRLLDAVEARLAAGHGGAGMVEALQRAGVSHLVVRNDLHRTRTDAPRRVLVHQAIADLPGVDQAAAFGPQMGARDDPDEASDSRLDVSYPAVEVYRIGDPGDTEHRVRAYPLEGSVRMSGGPESLLTAGDAGLLEDRAVFVAGDGAGVEDPAPVPVVTDGLRRRAVWFGAVRDNATEVLAADDDGPLDRAVRDYLPVDDPSRETVVVVDGVAAVDASSSGADPRATMARGAEHSPWAAVDGDVATSWISGEYGQAVGQWLEVRFDRPRTVQALELVTLDEAPVSAPIERVSVTTDAGVVETALQPGAGAHPVVVPPGETTLVRVEVLEVGPGTPSGVGIRELRIPGLSVRRTLAVPSVPAADLGGVEPERTLTFAVAEGRRGECVITGSAARCAPHLARTGEEHGQLRRRAELAGGGSYTATATVRPRPGPELEELIGTEPDAVRAEASSRAVADPLGRPQAAVDRDPGTGWVAAADDATPTLTLSWDERRRVEGLQFIVEPWLAASRPRLVEVAGGDRRYQIEVDDEGNAALPEPVRASELTVRILEVDEVVDTDASFGLRTVLPAGVSELRIVGADHLRMPVDETAPVHIPCGSGPDLVIDSAVLATEVSGTVGDLLRGRRLEARVCGGQDALRLEPGEHDFVVRSSASTRPETLTLRPDGPPVPEPGEPPEVHVRSWEPAHRQVAVSERDVPAVLSVAENANPGWEATLGGRRLEPVRLDGWSQGFVLPPGEAGVVELNYRPDTPYRLALGTGVAAVASVAVLAWRGTGTPRRTTSGGHGARLAARHRRDRVASVLTIASVALVLMGGPAGLGAVGVGVAVMLAGTRWHRVRRIAPMLAAAAVLLAGLIVAARPWPGPDPGAHSGLAQVLVLAGIAIAVLGSLSWDRPGGSTERDEQYVALTDIFDRPGHDVPDRGRRS